MYALLIKNLCMPLPDTAKVLSRFNNIILARVFGHSDVAELAEHGTVPGDLLH